LPDNVKKNIVGVPFIIRAGLGLQRSQTDVKILFRRAASSQGLWPTDLVDNQLCIRIQPTNHVELDLVIASPSTLNPTLDTASTRFGGVVPDSSSLNPYQRLLLDVTRGQVANFARTDALHAAYRVLQPLINMSPQTTYPLGSKYGPEASDAIISKELGNNHPWIGLGVENDDSEEAVWKETIDSSILASLRLELHIGLVQMRILVRKMLQEMRAGLRDKVLSFFSKCDMNEINTLP